MKGQTRSGEDFFFACREMTAWVAGLGFLAANLSALELMGWAAASLSSANSQSFIMQLRCQAVFVMQTAENGRRGDVAAIRQLVAVQTGRNLGLERFRDPRS
jgi:hypothetical protein